MSSTRETLKDLQTLAEKFNLPIEEVERIYREKYEWVASKLKGYKQEVIHSYALRIASALLGRRSRLTGVRVVPLGWSSEKVSKKARKVVAVFGLATTASGKAEKTIILFLDDYVEKVSELNLLHIYYMTLLKTSGGYVTTDETEIVSEKPLDIDSEELYKKLGFKKFELCDIYDNLSARREDGYVDEWDMRFCDAVVLKSSVFRHPKTGVERGVITVNDASLYKTAVLPDGKVLPSVITVWCPKEFAIYAEGSLVRILGTVVMTNEEEPQINAISVLPIDNLYEVVV
ncbi:MAG: hypothetical protein QXW42_04420 [Thermofilum sp.]